jgi:hypothetical protein
MAELMTQKGSDFCILGNFLVSHGSLLSEMGQKKGRRFAGGAHHNRLSFHPIQILKGTPILFNRARQPEYPVHMIYFV